MGDVGKWCLGGWLGPRILVIRQDIPYLLGNFHFLFIPQVHLWGVRVLLTSLGSTTRAISYPSRESTHELTWNPGARTRLIRNLEKHQEIITKKPLRVSKNLLGLTCLWTPLATCYYIPRGTINPSPHPWNVLLFCYRNFLTDFAGVQKLNMIYKHAVLTQ